MSSPVVISPQIIGDWRAAMDKDNSVAGQLSTSGQLITDNTAVEIYKNAPATGCATVITLARIRAGYNPLDPAQAGNQAAFNNWISQVKESGFFTLDYSNSIPLGGVNNWQAYLTQATNQYVGISSADVARLQQSIYQLVQAAYSMPGRPETVQMVQQSIQANTDGSVSAYFYFTSASIVYNQGGKHSSSTLGSVFTVYRTKFTMTLQTWDARANEVLNDKVHLVKNWLDSMNGHQAVMQMAQMDLASGVNNMSCFHKIPSLQDARTRTNVNDYWNSFSWSDFELDVQEQWAVLGWNSDMWDGPVSNYPSSFTKEWSELNPTEQAAAKKLSYTEVTWNSPSVSEAIQQPNINTYWDKFAWTDFAPQLLQWWETLGWNSDSWSGNAAAPASSTKLWAQLNSEEQHAASMLGYLPAVWDQH